MATNFSDKNISSIKLNAEKYNLKSIPFHATEIEWSAEHLDYIPKQGEIVVYDKDDTYNYERIKVGDGLTSIVNLPFYLASELNYIDGVTSSIQTQLNKKANDFSIEIYNGTGGNPKPVRFASFNYSTCTSETGIAAKISLVSGHGNGTSYAFLEDAIIRVTHQGGVEVDNFKYYGAATGTYDGAERQYGDIFWLIDTTNKIVDFYVLMGQYARMYQTPWKRLTYSTGGTVTQHTSCTVYSSGTKTWANNSDIALMSDLTSLSNRLSAIESSIVTVHSGAETPVSTLGENGDLYLVTE